jgi:3-isopropylmalate dehydrogenase
LKIAILPGDGVGPEIVAEAVKLLERLRREGLPIETESAAIGGAGYDAAQEPLPEATLELAQAADAIVLGAVGGPRYDALPRALRPEQGILAIRKALGLFANLRPALLCPELAAVSSLKPEIVSGLDLPIVRELTGDIYFGAPRGRRRNAAGEQEGFDTMLYRARSGASRVSPSRSRKRRKALLGRQGERARYVDPVARDRHRHGARTRTWPCRTCTSTTRRCSSCATRSSST